jgi:hypothetical protein
MSYLSNVKAWAVGYGKFDEVSFKPGWSGKSIAWLLLYTWNYGTRVLTGGACVSWSRWFYAHAPYYRWAKFITRLLNKLDDNHGANAGEVLWKTTDTTFAKEGAITFWAFILFLMLWPLW